MIVPALIPTVAQVLTHVVVAPHVVAPLPLAPRLAPKVVRVIASATVGVAARKSAAIAHIKQIAPVATGDTSADPADMATSGVRLAPIAGAQLRRLRKQSGWTQRELAERLNYSQQQIAAWERGRHRIPASLVPRLLDLLLDAKQQRENLNSLMTSIERWPTVGEW